MKRLLAINFLTVMLTILTYGEARAQPAWNNKGWFCTTDRKDNPIPLDQIRVDIRFSKSIPDVFCLGNEKIYKDIKCHDFVTNPTSYPDTKLEATVRLVVLYGGAIERSATRVYQRSMAYLRERIYFNQYSQIFENFFIAKNQATGDQQSLVDQLNKTNLFATQHLMHASEAPRTFTTTEFTPNRTRFYCRAYLPGEGEFLEWVPGWN